MFRCGDCEAEFETTATYSESHGSDTPPYEKRSCCPACGSVEIVELHRCNICGGHYPYEEMSSEDDDVCSECAGNTFAQWDRIKNDALNAYFTPAQVEFLKGREVA